MMMRRQSPAAAALEPMARSSLPRFLALRDCGRLVCGQPPAGGQAGEPAFLGSAPDRPEFRCAFRGGTCHGLTADTALLETPAFLFTPRIGIFNQDPYARFHPTHVLVMSAIDGRVLGRDAWFEEGSKFGQPLRTARLVWTDWAVDGGRRGRKRFRLQLYELKGE